jgi:outer membrane protein insertion porin family
MQNIIARFCQFIFLLMLISSCSSTRHLPPGEKLYTGARVTVNGASTVRQKKVLTEDLDGLTRPKPNSKFLGLRLKLGIYNLFRNKKENSFFGRIRERSGEPPVLLSQVDLQQNVKVVQSHLENKGYFRASVKGDTIVRGKTGRATYIAETGSQYMIGSVTFPEDSTPLSSVVRESARNSLLLVGKPFDLDVIKAERERIDAYLKERGFYYFSPNYLIMRTDSTSGGQTVRMEVAIKRDMPFMARDVYRINNIFIYPDYSLNTAAVDTNIQNVREHEGYYVIDREQKFKPVLFEEAMDFQRGEVYNRRSHNRTLSRLTNLDVFKFVKNRFELNDTTPLPDLDVYYYLTPFPKRSIRAEISTITRSNNLNGSLISVNWKNRNLFRAGEQLGVSIYVGTDVQFSGALRGYNTFRSGAELNFSVPRLLLPVRRPVNRSGYVPRTNFQIGYDLLSRTKLYTLSSFRAAVGYLWKQSLRKQHELYPISINYIRPMNVSAIYDSLISQDTLLARAIQRQFILGSTYQYTFNQLAAGTQRTNSYYLNMLIDLSGNIAGMLSGANVKEGKEVRIKNVPFAQYIKTEFDGRYYRKIGLYSTWANRVIVGIGIPYGNSVQLPFIKQFFIGGNNSLRGFRSRSVGPGTYRYPGTQNFLPDETGDIKLELNSEFRFRLSGPLYGAVFMDAGNIWLMNDSSFTHKPGGEFTSAFLNQLAVDAGIGIRFDVRLFVIRLDVAFPLRKPWEQNPWVLNQIRLNKIIWRRENIVYNLGIGYPF